MSRRRLAAIAAIVLAAATAVLAIIVAIQDFPQGVWVVLCLLVAAAAAWYALVRRGIARIAGLTIAVLALAGAIVLIAGHHRLVEDIAVLVGVFLSLGAARAAFVVHVSLPDAPAPRQPVLFYNPKSGGGKAEKFQLADQARARDIRPVELRLGDDLESLVRDAVSRGADGLAMAGGDGSQAIVASVAAELRPPLRVHSGGDAQPLRARPGGRCARTSSGPWTRSSTAASGAWISPRSTAAYS